MNTATLKFGKLAAKADARAIPLRAIMRAKAIKVPTEWNVDDAHPGAGPRMFANDQYGCCVIATRAAQTLRFELAETGKLPTITDNQVVKEYMRQTGGEDSGLVMLDSLNYWRRVGWRPGLRIHKIQAFATLDPTNPIDFKLAIYGDLGCEIGVALPTSAMRELQAGKPWTQTKGPGSAWGSLGGHAIYAKGYNRDGLILETWGMEQFASWAWIKKYCDESFAVIDAINTKRKRLLFDAGLIRTMLAR